RRTRPAGPVRRRRAPGSVRTGPRRPGRAGPCGGESCGTSLGLPLSATLVDRTDVKGEYSRVQTLRKPEPGARPGAPIHPFSLRPVPAVVHRVHAADPPGACPLVVLPAHVSRERDRDVPPAQ